MQCLHNLQPLSIAAFENHCNFPLVCSQDLDGSIPEAAHTTRTDTLEVFYKSFCPQIGIAYLRPWAPATPCTLSIGCVGGAGWWHPDTSCKNPSFFASSLRKAGSNGLLHKRVRLMKEPHSFLRLVAFQIIGRHQGGQVPWSISHSWSVFCCGHRPA